MDEKLTAQLQEWLNTPAEERSVETGAMLVRRITRNVVLANNYERLPLRFGKMVEYQLRKCLPMRLDKKTHDDVVQMSKQVKQISKDHKLDEPIPGNPKQSEERRLQRVEPFRSGKRKDHDSLPEDIQACYAENLHLMQQMRHNRAQLLVIMNTKDKTVCQDNDRYPFVKEIINLDARYRANWQKYDEYVAQDGDN